MLPPTHFRLLHDVSGLTVDDVCEIFDLSKRTVYAYRAGQRSPAPEVFVELAYVITNQRLVSEALIDEIARSYKPTDPDEPVLVNFVRDDAEARELGWPCANAQHVSAAKVIAWCEHYDIPSEPVYGDAPAIEDLELVDQTVSDARIVKSDG